MCQWLLHNVWYSQITAINFCSNSNSKFKFKIPKRFIETNIHMQQRCGISIICIILIIVTLHKDISKSTLKNMCISAGRQNPGSLYGLHYDAWSYPDSNVGRAKVGPTSGRQYRSWANFGPTHTVIWESYSLLVMRRNFNCQGHHQCK